jgi:hypothetical protein
MSERKKEKQMHVFFSCLVEKKRERKWSGALSKLRN